MKTFALVLSLLITGFAAEARGIVPADYMKCSDVIEQYERDGRIYVIANGKDVVPLYGYKKISESKYLRCPGRGKHKTAYWANTLDTDFCVFAYYCQ